MAHDVPAPATSWQASFELPALNIPKAVHGSSTTSPRGIVVFSGGSAANGLVDIFNELSQQQSASLSYIIPISDNGGSSSELIRVFGGPGMCWRPTSAPILADED